MIRRFLKYIDLRPEVEDYDTIHESIVKDIDFKGTNLWILVFAIVVASVGLNTNSTAVIIGAMLISPLMGPINGIGYSIATYDFLLLKRAIKNFSFAVVASLFASFAYFFISPVSTAHSELLARTSPNIYDVLIALFGGFAGIVAISSKKKGNVIPGVAIATALMPPLCTAGYGLATGQINFFLGAFYLFTINTVFIAFASLVVCQALRFPIRTIINTERKKRVNQIISMVITITILPSLYFGYRLVIREKYHQNAVRFSENVSIVDGNYLLKREINPDNKKIVLIYGGSSITRQNKKFIFEMARQFGIDTANITLLDSYVHNLAEQNEAEILKLKINALQQTIANQKLKIDSLNDNFNTGGKVLNELKILFPDIQSCVFTKAKQFYVDGKQENNDILLLTFKPSVPSEDVQQKIQVWAMARFSNQNIKVYFNN